VTSIPRCAWPLLSLLSITAALRASASVADVDLEAVLDHHAAAHGLPRDEALVDARHVVANLDAFGMTGRLENWSEHPLRSWTRLELGPMVLETGYDGNNGWIRDRNGLVRKAEGLEENGLLLEALVSTGAYVLRRPPIAMRRDLLAVSDSTVSLFVEPLLGEAEILLLDAHSHRLLESRWNSGQFDERTSYTDYDWMSGLLMPRRTLLQMGDQFEFRATLVEFERAEARGADFYRMPDATARNQILLSQATDSGRIPMIGEGHHILLHGSIGEESGNFLLDSGAGSNVIHEGRLEKLGLASLGAVEAMGVAGSQRASFVDIAEVDLLGLRLLQQSWMSLDFSELEFALGHPLLGVLGYDTFFQLITHVHYGERWVRFYDVGQFVAPEDAIPLPLRLDANVPTIEVSIEGIPAWVHVDTGSDNTLDLARPFVELHHLLTDRGQLGESGVAGLGGVGKSQRGSLRDFRMGPFEYDDFTAYFHEAGDGIFENRSVAGILGAGVLADFECWFDYSRHTLWLRSLSDTGR